MMGGSIAQSNLQFVISLDFSITVASNMFGATFVEAVMDAFSSHWMVCLHDHSTIELESLLVYCLEDARYAR